MSASTLASVVPQLAALATEIRDGVSDGPVLTCGVAVPGLYIPETGVVVFLTNVPGDWSATPTGEPIAAAEGAALNVRINLPGLTEGRVAAEIDTSGGQLSTAAAVAQRVLPSIVTVQVSSSDVGTFVPSGSGSGVVHGASHGGHEPCRSARRKASSV